MINFYLLNKFYYSSQKHCWQARLVIQKFLRGTWRVFLLPLFFWLFIWYERKKFWRYWKEAIWMARVITCSKFPKILSGYKLISLEGKNEISQYFWWNVFHFQNFVCLKNSRQNILYTNTEEISLWSIKKNLCSQSLTKELLFLFSHTSSFLWRIWQSLTTQNDFLLAQENREFIWKFFRIDSQACQLVCLHLNESFSMVPIHSGSSFRERVY